MKKDLQTEVRSLTQKVAKLKKMVRKNGYYWVKVDGVWKIGYWVEDCWFIMDRFDEKISVQDIDERPLRKAPAR